MLINSLLTDTNPFNTTQDLKDWILQRNQEVDVKPQENKFNDKILNLIYKFPTRSRITRAKLEDEGAGNQNVKTSIYNKKAVMRKDQ